MAMGVGQPPRWNLEFRYSAVVGTALDTAYLRTYLHFTALGGLAFCSVPNLDTVLPPCCPPIFPHLAFLLSCPLLFYYFVRVFPSILPRCRAVCVLRFAMCTVSCMEKATQLRLRYLASGNLVACVHVSCMQAWMCMCMCMCVISVCGQVSVVRVRASSSFLVRSSSLPLSPRAATGLTPLPPLSLLPAWFCITYSLAGFPCLTLSGVFRLSLCMSVHLLVLPCSVGTHVRYVPANKCLHLGA